MRSTLAALLLALTLGVVGVGHTAPVIAAKCSSNSTVIVNRQAPTDVLKSFGSGCTAAFSTYVSAPSPTATPTTSPSPAPVLAVFPGDRDVTIILQPGDLFTGTIGATLHADPVGSATAIDYPMSGSFTLGQLDSGSTDSLHIPLLAKDRIWKLLVSAPQLSFFDYSVVVIDNGPAASPSPSSSPTDTSSPSPTP